MKSSRIIELFFYNKVMKTIKLNKMEKDKAIDILLNGGILAFPTDTVFGLAAMPKREDMDKVYEAKGRSFDKPLPMMCNSIEMIERYAYVSEEAKKIMKAFVPGPLTLIFKKRVEIGDYITNGMKTIGIRVPDDDWILSLLEELDEPLMVTSANLSNHPSLLKWAEVYEQLDGRIDGIVMEDARGDKASTIVDVTSEMKILREGPISIEQILEVLK